MSWTARPAGPVVPHTLTRCAGQSSSLSPASVASHTTGGCGYFRPWENDVLFHNCDFQCAVIPFSLSHLYLFTLCNVQLCLNYRYKRVHRALCYFDYIGIYKWWKTMKYLSYGSLVSCILKLYPWNPDRIPVIYICAKVCGVPWNQWRKETNSKCTSRPPSPGVIKHLSGLRTHGLITCVCSMKIINTVASTDLQTSTDS